MAPTPHPKLSDISQFTLDIIKNGKSVWVEANGYSMFPTLKPGQQIQISPVAIEAISVGDIVAFQRKNYFVAHRVHKKYTLGTTTTLLTKGDAHFRLDEQVDHLNFLGKITHLKKNDLPIELPPMYAKTMLETLYAWVRVKFKIHLGWF